MIFHSHNICFVKSRKPRAGINWNTARGCSIFRKHEYHHLKSLCTCKWSFILPLATQRATSRNSRNIAFFEIRFEYHSSFVGLSMDKINIPITRNIHASPKYIFLKDKMKSQKSTGQLFPENLYFQKRRKGFINHVFFVRLIIIIIPGWLYLLRSTFWIFESKNQSMSPIIMFPKPICIS